MGATHQALLLYGGFVPKAVQFDGSTNWLDKASDFTGNADGTTGIFSFWFRVDSLVNPNDQVYIYYGPNVTYGPKVSLGLAAVGVRKIGFQSYTGIGGNRVFITSTTQFTAGATWHHCIITWDSASAANCKMYIDGTDDSPVVSVTAGTISYTGTDHTIGAAVTGASNKLNGCLCELYYAPNQWVDITVAATLQKWRSATGHPAFLGTTGSAPTGTAPIYYMKGIVSSVATNFGTGGNMTAHGVFANASTAP